MAERRSDDARPCYRVIALSRYRAIVKQPTIPSQSLPRSVLLPRAFPLCCLAQCVARPLPCSTHSLPSCASFPFCVLVLDSFVARVAPWLLETIVDLSKTTPPPPPYDDASATNTDEEDTGCLSLLIDPDFTFSCPSSLDEVLESQAQQQSQYHARSQPTLSQPIEPSASLQHHLPPAASSVAPHVEQSTSCESIDVEPTTSKIRRPHREVSFTAAASLYSAFSQIQVEDSAVSLSHIAHSTDVAATTATETPVSCTSTVGASTDIVAQSLKMDIRCSSNDHTEDQASIDLLQDFEASHSLSRTSSPERLVQLLRLQSSTGSGSGSLGSSAIAALDSIRHAVITAPQDSSSLSYSQESASTDDGSERVATNPTTITTTATTTTTTTTPTTTTMTSATTESDQRSTKSQTPRTKREQRTRASVSSSQPRRSTRSAAGVSTMLPPSSSSSQSSTRSTRGSVFVSLSDLFKYVSITSCHDSNAK